MIFLCCFYKNYVSLIFRHFVLNTTQQLVKYSVFFWAKVAPNLITAKYYLRLSLLLYIDIAQTGPGPGTVFNSFLVNTWWWWLLKCGKRTCLCTRCFPYYHYDKQSVSVFLSVSSIACLFHRGWNTKQSTSSQSMYLMFWQMFPLVSSFYCTRLDELGFPTVAGWLAGHGLFFFILPKLSIFIWR